MGVPRLLFLKQFFTKPTFQTLNFFRKQPAKSQFNSPRRTLSSAAANTLISSEIVKFVSTSPNASVVSLLEQYLVEDKGLLQHELANIARKLRKLRRFDRALEIYEWMSQKSLSDSIDVAVHLDLIGKTHGVEAAEKFFYKTNGHCEKVYGSMLNLYVQAKLVDKSLSLFEKMKELGIVSTSLTYNSIMSLYLKTEQSEKVLALLLEMQGNGISSDNVSYRMFLKACARTSDFDSIDKTLKAIENEPHLSIDWFTYSTVANYYIEGGQPEKARDCLQKAEGGVHDNAVGYNNLITTYTKLGDVTEVTRLLQKQLDVCKTRSNTDYLVMLSALVKLDQFHEAKRLLEEWESSGHEHDSRIPDALLAGYAHKEQVEEAERILEGMISSNKYPTTAPSSWVIISEGYVKRLNMPKAVQCMQKALELGPQHKGWLPKRGAISNLLNWLGDHGQVEQVYEFLKLMSQVVPMNKNMYQALLKTCKRHKKDFDDILQRMKADNIDVDEETSKLIIGECHVKLGLSL